MVDQVLHEVRVQPMAEAQTRLLLAEDEPVTRRMLEALLTRFGYNVITAADGTEAWNILQQDNAPALVVLDWTMPGLDGPEICRKVRADPRNGYTYMLMVTSRAVKNDVVEALSAGADDFIPKPVDASELRARLRVGERVVRLEQTLKSQLHELASALEHVHELQGMIPICMHCKRIRNQEKIWEKVETYFEQRSGAKFSHALCLECLERHYPSEHDS